mgnify:CR=1 FL=1
MVAGMPVRSEQQPPKRLGWAETGAGLCFSLAMAAWTSDRSACVTTTSLSRVSGALVIVTPATATGSSTANGVTRPVRPVLTAICRTRAVRSSFGTPFIANPDLPERLPAEDMDVEVGHFLAGALARIRHTGAHSKRLARLDRFGAELHVGAIGERGEQPVVIAVALVDRFLPDRTGDDLVRTIRAYREPLLSRSLVLAYADHHAHLVVPAAGLGHDLHVVERADGHAHAPDLALGDVGDTVEDLGHGDLRAEREQEWCRKSKCRCCQ